MVRDLDNTKFGPKCAELNVAIIHKKNRARRIIGGGFFLRILAQFYNFIRIERTINEPNEKKKSRITEIWKLKKKKKPNRTC